MKIRTAQEIAKFFGVKEDDVNLTNGYSDNESEVIWIAVRFRRVTINVVQAKRASSRRDAHGKGKGSLVFHGRFAKGGGERT